jgi:putative NADH-flavin reductase
MRLFVLGATGSIGSALIDIGIARGHRATAFVRSPGKLTPRSGLDIVGGSPLETSAIRTALPGHDVVFSAIGPRPPATFFASTLVSDCAASTVAAMTETGVARLVIVSAAFLFPGTGLAVSFVRWMLKNHGRDLSTMEALVGASDLDWTIARPSQLKERTDTGYRVETGRQPENGFSVGIRAVASFMLDAAEKRSHLREIVGVAQ